ncbi:MAG: T9SS type A sorting domain-containing protein, partial [Flammeovirgaceae bacterium]|nr:T9SS type A sorting domain-containing protein [Flammeovirgaceae bacterium]
LSNVVQTIAFTQPGNVTFGDADFQLLATASSALPVSLVSSDPSILSITGTTATILSAGSVSITASQSGNLDYGPALDVIHMVVVNKKDQTIIFPPLNTVTVGTSPFDLSATSSSGLAVSYTSSNTNVVTIANATATIVGAGTSTITASQAGDANHNAATSITQDLIVNKMTQTITFGAIDDQLLEDGSMTLSASASSGLAVAFEIVSGPASVTGTELSFTGMGTIIVKATQAGNDSFLAASAVEQSFDIISITGLEISRTSLSIYPNPTSDFLHVQLSDPDRSAIHLMSADGRSVMDMKKAQKVIDVSSLPKGMYFITIVSPQQKSTHKFIKN